MPDIPAEVRADTRYQNTMHPRIRGRCPSCGSESLFLGSGGYVTCSVLGCKDPGAPHDLLADGGLAAERRGAQPEICICAALQLPNGEVWRGHRHNDAIRTMVAAYPSREAANEAIRGATQGFVTSRNRFVDREEGARLQREAGIVSAETSLPVGSLLFSEDLYLRDWRSPSSSAGQPLLQPSPPEGAQQG